MLSILKPIILACSIVASPDQSLICERETAIFPSTFIAGSFCLEEMQVCCAQSMCETTFALACYPDRIFVGNMESLTTPPR